MKLNFFGTGSAFYPPYGNTGAYLLRGRELYLIDCGETAFDFLYRRLPLDQVERVYVLLTHLHADHVGSLGTLISYFYCLRRIQVQVIHPEETVRELLRLLGIPKEGFAHLPRMPENRARLHARPVPVRHVPGMKCYGYLLSDETETIYYSGDACSVPEEILDAFLAGRICRLYQDTSTHDSPEPSHCYYGTLEKLIPKEKRGQVYCIHLDGPCRELLWSRGFRTVQVEKPGKGG